MSRLGPGRPLGLIFTGSYFPPWCGGRSIGLSLVVVHCSPNSSLGHSNAGGEAHHRRRGVPMKTLLLAGASILAVGVSSHCAYAQTAPPSPPVVTPFWSPTPPDGCVWAGLPYSNGAQLCMAPKLVAECKTGTWVIQPSSLSPDPCANYQPR
jgi:hypothetical protein